MRYLSEIIKLIEAGINSDPMKIKSYAQLLAQKLEKDGETVAAQRVLTSLNDSNGIKLHASFLNRYSKVPLDSESKMSLGETDFFSDGKVSLFLNPEAEEKISEFVSFASANDKLSEFDLVFSQSLLMHGPPGCGKTEAARYIASKLSLPLVTARVDSLISSYLGSTSKNIRSLFDYANNNPCVLFLDEFDALAKVRDDKFEMGELKRVVVGLLQNIDRLNNDVVFLGATNHPHLLDNAIWRRFTYKVQIDEPNLETRKKLFQQFIKGKLSAEEIIQLSSLTEHFSGAELRQLCESSLRRFLILKSDSNLFETTIRVLISHLLENKLDAKTKEEKILALRDVNSKIFTYERLSDIFEISTGSISKLVHRNK